MHWSSAVQHQPRSVEEVQAPWQQHVQWINIIFLLFSIYTELRSSWQYLAPVCSGTYCCDDHNRLVQSPAAALVHWPRAGGHGDADIAVAVVPQRMLLLLLHLLWAARDTALLLKEILLWVLVEVHCSGSSEKYLVTTDQSMKIAVAVVDSLKLETETNWLLMLSLSK